MMAMGYAPEQMYGRGPPPNMRGGMYPGPDYGRMDGWMGGMQNMYPPQMMGMPMNPMVPSLPSLSLPSLPPLPPHLSSGRWAAVACMMVLLKAGREGLRLRCLDSTRSTA
jgi:hypothetical protein